MQAATTARPFATLAIHLFMTSSSCGETLDIACLFLSQLDTFKLGYLVLHRLLHLQVRHRFNRDLDHVCVDRHLCGLEPLVHPHLDYLVLQLQVQDVDQKPAQLIDPCGEGLGTVVGNGKRTGFTSPKVAYTTEERLKDMDAQSIDVQVVSIHTPFFGYHLDASQGARLAREVNDEIAGMTREHPKRFAGLATHGSMKCDTSPGGCARTPADFTYEIIVINKSDLVADERRSALHDALRAAYPHADVLSASARTGAGLDEWFHRIASAESDDRQAPGLDYELYADGEALLPVVCAVSRLDVPAGCHC